MSSNNGKAADRSARTRLTPWAVLSAALLLGACSHQGAGGGDAAGSVAAGGERNAGARAATLPGVKIGSNKSFAKVTYKPAVKVIEESGFAKTLAGASKDGTGLVFHDAPADIRALKAGDVLLIKNQLARKVLATQTDGKDTYVATAKAMITDLVNEGQIHIDAPLVFSRAAAPSSARASQAAPDLLSLLIPNAEAQSAEALVQKQMENSEYKDQLKTAVQQAILADWSLTQFQYSASDGLLNFTLALAKNYQGFIGKVAASGFINNFDFWSDISVSRGLVNTIGAGLKNLSGKLHFDWEIAKQTPGGWGQEDLVKLPGALSVPLGTYLYGLPLSLEVSSALVIHPALTGGNEISTGGFTITLAGQMSTSISSGGAVDQGSSIDQTFQITNDSGLSAVAPNAMVIAYAAPRVELSIDAFGSYKEQLGKLADTLTSKFASTLDAVQAGAAKVASSLAPGVDTGLNKIKAQNVLQSKADVYAQLVSTEGTVHSASITMVPCSKKWISFEGVVGTAADIAGLTPNAKRSAVVFQKRYDKADPPSNFCEKVGE
jgi:hypothetical protein